ncbi:MAG: CPBP family intramembrane glutamic endopeptidase [Thermoguttaceae bacterium]
MEDEVPPLRHFALLAAAFEGGLVVVALGLGWLVGQEPLESFHWSLADAGWGVVATLPPLALFWLCLQCPIRPVKRLVRVVDEMLVPLFRDCRILDLAVISALAGLSEEMLFRGVIQQAVADATPGQAGVWIGLAVAAILFGLAHRITNTYALLAGVIGLYLGAVWLMTGNLLVPIVAHALYDCLALIFLVRIRRAPTVSP